ncbi:aldo/keto reductase [Nocardia sp. NBC_01009]|uniref:aldo/keto reductase n=1 Tax=Nocardia sp. NBC_01009 TaxID=2975996 RepID=UPI0038663772|nr:aldo/keto reductase [Nocardia sp. NBC_01009]
MTENVITLNNGVNMPAVGLGVFQTPPEVTTAAAYLNEREVGTGIRHSGIARDEVFIETKVWISDYGYDATTHAFDKAVGKLGVNQLDLLILHQPLPSRFDLTLDAYRALEKLLADGKVTLNARVSRITLIRELGNSLDMAAAHAIREAAERTTRWAADGTIRVAVIAARGSTFCVGGDLICWRAVDRTGRPLTMVRGTSIASPRAPRILRACGIRPLRNMRTYLRLKERAQAFRADPEVRQALSESGVADLRTPALAPGENYVDLLADPALAEFDADKSAQRGYGFVRLNQLALEQLLGAPHRIGPGGLVRGHQIALAGRA